MQEWRAFAGEDFVGKPQKPFQGGTECRVWESVNREHHQLCQRKLTVPGIDNIQAHSLEV
jgi:hypothetical protein